MEKTLTPGTYVRLNTWTYATLATRVVPVAWFTPIGTTGRIVRIDGPNAAVVALECGRHAVVHPGALSVLETL